MNKVGINILPRDFFQLMLLLLLSIYLGVKLLGHGAMHAYPDLAR